MLSSPLLDSALLSLALFRLFEAVNAELVASIIIPHGDFAYDPFLPHGCAERNAAAEVALAARKASAFLMEKHQPDLLLISTPHGMELSHDFAIYLGSNASGYADIGQDLHDPKRPPYRVHMDTMPLAPVDSKSLVDFLLQHDFGAVSGILNFADSEDMPLRWGEVVPLSILLQNASTISAEVRRRLVGQSRISSTTTNRPELMILSHPLRRYTQDPPSFVPELLKLGRMIRKWTDTDEAQASKRIMLVISADMSHTHRADGPYGYSPNSSIFDEAVGEWASNPAGNADQLLVNATSIQTTALSCGYTGMVMTHGALVSGEVAYDGIDEEQKQQQENAWEAKVWANRNVTYYGMMVATFSKQAFVGTARSPLAKENSKFTTSEC